MRLRDIIAETDYAKLKNQRTLITAKLLNIRERYQKLFHLKELIEARQKELQAEMRKEKRP